jgi:hypothetical protein
MRLGVVKQRLAVLLGEALPAVTVTPYRSDNPAVPGICLGEAVCTQRRATHAGKQLWTLTAYVFTSHADDLQGQQDLDVFLAETGSGSLLAALEAYRRGVFDAAGDRLCDWLVAAQAGVGGYRTYSTGVVDLYGATVDLEVMG